MSNKALLCALLIAVIVFDGLPLASAPVSAPAIEWQKYYGGSAVSVSNLIQTTDGGYIFMDLGWRYNVGFAPSTVYKVDSSGNVQWSKTIGSYNTSEYLEASSIIQTNDGGYEIAGGWTIGVTYRYTPTLVKMDSQGNIQWVANFSSVPNLGTTTSTRIRTSDGGSAYWTDGSIIKTDSNNNTQWVETFNFTDSSGRLSPLFLFWVIETSDGALAALGVGTYWSGNPRTGGIYLIKTEAFLPLPSQTPLPTPIPTSTPLPALTVEAAVIASLMIAVVVGAGLLVYFKKRKH
jgi:hypothetical protein